MKPQPVAPSILREQPCFVHFPTNLQQEEPKNEEGKIEMAAANRRLNRVFPDVADLLDNELLKAAAVRDVAQRSECYPS